MGKPQNYVADRNPFGMAKPPDWWLFDIYKFDSDILVMPSRQRIGVYWLTRRLKWTAEIVQEANRRIRLDPATDAAMFATHNVERVTDITTPLGIWSTEKVIAWLSARDTWAYEDGPLDAQGLKKALMNGGSKFTKALEQFEAEQEAKVAAQQRETVYHATGDAWESLQRRKGSRTSNAGMPTTNRAGRQQRKKSPLLAARPARPGSPILAGV